MALEIIKIRGRPGSGDLNTLQTEFLANSGALLTMPDETGKEKDGHRTSDSQLWHPTEAFSAISALTETLTFFSQS